MNKIKSNRLVHLQCRVSKERYLKFHEMASQSNGLTISEVVRNILENKTVRLSYQNMDLDHVMHQLANIYLEIHRIGVNVNQVTKEFHQANQPIQKFLLGKKLIDQQKALVNGIDSLKPVLSELQKRWLSG